MLDFDFESDLNRNGLELRPLDLDLERFVTSPERNNMDYNLRPARNHDRQLMRKSTYINNSLFIVRMLYKSYTDSVAVPRFFSLVYPPKFEHTPGPYAKIEYVRIRLYSSKDRIRV